MLPLLLSFFCLQASAQDRVVFTSLTPANYDHASNSDLYFLEQGKVLQLTDDPYDDYSPTLSPDGKWVVFITDRWKHESDGDSQLALLNVDTKEVARLDIGWRFWAHAPHFSKDGKQIYFSRAKALVENNEPMGNYLLFSLNFKTKALTQLTQHPYGNYLDPIPAPNGKSLAFRYAADGRQVLKILDLNNLKEESLSITPQSEAAVYKPAWRSQDVLTFMSSHGQGEPLMDNLFSLNLHNKQADQILIDSRIRDFNSICWLSPQRGYLSARTPGAAAIEIYAFSLTAKGLNLKIVSPPDFRVSTDIDCR